MFQNQTILITGGTGSWANELIRQLVTCQPKEIRIFSRNELSQIKLQRLYKNEKSLKFIIGDIRDYNAVKEASKDVDYLFHLAALKHVPICEIQPQEAIKTNINGTQNVINASISQGIKKVINVSSDKAADPINIYGMTKAIGEKLMINANECSDFTRFVCIRGGNVMGTNGSIIPLFKNQIKTGQNVTITSPEMTRFFITLPQAINLLLNAAQNSVGGETFILNMKSCKIVDLAQVLIKKIGTGKVNVDNIGIRPGEKLHEVLISKHEATRTKILNKEYFIILPEHLSSNAYTLNSERYGQLSNVKFIEYSSNSKLMSEQEIFRMLKVGGFIN